MFLGAVLEIVNNLPQEEERKRIISDLVDKLAPMNIIHQIGGAQTFAGAGVQFRNGIVVDHVAQQFKLEESTKYAFEVIDNISHNERKQMLAGVREIVWDFHNLVKVMIEPFIVEESEEPAND